MAAEGAHRGIILLVNLAMMAVMAAIMAAEAEGGLTASTALAKAAMEETATGAWSFSPHSVCMLENREDRAVAAVAAQAREQARTLAVVAAARPG